MTLLEYLSAKGYSVTRIGKDQYSGLPDEMGTPHDNFIYDESSDKWMWEERAKSGFGLNDYLKKILGIRPEDIESHIEEASNVTEGSVIPQEVVSHEKHRILTPAESSDDEYFNLPPKSVATHAVDKYYIHTLSISPTVIEWLEVQGLLYESNEQYQLKERRVFYHNAIFVCCDENFVAQGAVRKFLRPNKEGELQTNFVSRSDMVTGFSRIPPSCQVLMVFENIVEMLSYFTLIEREGRSFKNQPFVCLDGVKFSDSTLPKPLFTALKTHKQIRAVTFASGQKFMERAEFLKEKMIEKKRKSSIISTDYPSFSEELMTICPPNVSLERYVKQFKVEGHG